MSATVRATRECYASEHELFDIGLASVELHATGLGAPVSRRPTGGEPGEAARMSARTDRRRAAGDHAILLLLSLFLHAGEVGIVLALAGLFDLFDAAHPVLATLLGGSGCALVWYGWHGARAILARVEPPPAHAR